MKYEVRCECGKTHSVTNADAGMMLPCDCGRTVDVPPLHRLQAESGETANSPLDRVKGMVRVGLLPGTRECVSCHRLTTKPINVTIECERVATTGTPSRAEMLGCLLLPCFGWSMGLLIFFGLRTIRESVGDDVSVMVPLPACDVCRSQPSDPQNMLKSLHQIAEYASLLDRYPNAQIIRIG